MTTTSSAMFQTRNSHTAIRAAAILGLCTALAAGFVANASRAPQAAPAASDAIAGNATAGRSA